MEDVLKQKIIDYNNSVGNLKDYDCPICKNKGHILYEKNGYEYMRDCECMSTRELIRLANESGLGDVLKEYTFAKYTHDEEWQDKIYNTAIKFISDVGANCFYIGGQVGSGKTHICTAIVRELIKQHLNVKYVIWNEIVTKLKQNIVNDTDTFKNDIESLKKVQVLYIDDLFKTDPTKADIDKAFQIINTRYNLSKSNKDTRYITIISSEKTFEELIQVDEAIASRIMEMSKKEYALSIQKDINKNIRFR